MSIDFDLFGLPIPEGRGKRGRPAHVVTDENVRKVNLLLAFDRNNEEIAVALGISEPTLRKNYFHLLARRSGARIQAEAWMLVKLAGEVDAGNVAAAKELSRRFDRHDIGEAAKLAARTQRTDHSPPQGKKEERQARADGVSGKFAVPNAPRLVN